MDKFLSGFSFGKKHHLEGQFLVENDEKKPFLFSEMLKEGT